MPPNLWITALDSSVAVRFSETGSQSLVDAATRAWSRCLGDGRASRTAAPLEVPSPGSDTNLELMVAMQVLTQEVTHRLITAQVGQLLLLHAGAVSHPVTGESLVFVAPGGTGKTTLACVLGRTYGYLTDETVGIDDSGCILPYPKPLSLRLPDGGPKFEASPDALGLTRAHPHPIVKRVIVLSRPISHDGPPDIQELGTLDAVQQILPETSSLWRLPRPLRTLAELAEASGPVLLCSYAEADDLVALTGELIGAVP